MVLCAVATIEGYIDIANHMSRREEYLITTREGPTSKNPTRTGDMYCIIIMQLGLIAIIAGCPNVIATIEEIDTRIVKLSLGSAFYEQLHLVPKVLWRRSRLPP